MQRLTISTVSHVLALMRLTRLRVGVRSFAAKPSTMSLSAHDITKTRNIGEWR